jgi:predicted enzyme related to lactoylglutathione lyase
MFAYARLRDDSRMSALPLLHSVDAVTVPVPDLDTGLAFYRDCLGHPLLWRHDELGQAGLGLVTQGTELVLTTRASYAPSWLVSSAEDAATAVVHAGGRRISGPSDIPVGRLALVEDAFGNQLVMLDLSKGRYVTDDLGRVIGVQ